MKGTRRKNQSDDRFAAVTKPPLTDEAVIHIHRALENWLHLFEQQYCTQIWRYYEQHQHHSGPSQPPGMDDEEPF